MLRCVGNEIFESDGSLYRSVESTPINCALNGSLLDTVHNQSVLGHRLMCGTYVVSIQPNVILVLSTIVSAMRGAT